MTGITVAYVSMLVAGALAVLGALVAIGLAVAEGVHERRVRVAPARVPAAPRRSGVRHAHRVAHLH